MPDSSLTPREVAAELGVTVRTVQRWIAEGRLAAERVGGRVRVSRSSLATVH
jgi:excisionase family DNA binding protein